MKFLNFLRKKSEYNFEELLKKAADDAAYRNEFLKRILDEDLVLISDNSTVVPNGIVRLEKDTTVKILTFADGRIPVFTSTEKIFDKGIVKDQVNYIKAKGRDIFGFLKGKKLILNPYSDYGKEFLPEEIARLLDGSYFESKARQVVVEKNITYKIGQPARYPDKVVKSLITVFTANPTVTAAYVAWIHLEKGDEPPHYIFGIKTNGDWSELVEAAGAITVDLLPDEIVDFYQLFEDDKGIGNYFHSIKPFYVNAAAN